MVVLVMMVGGGIHFTTESHLHTLGETSAHQRRLLSVFTEVSLIRQND